MNAAIKKDNDILLHYAVKHKSEEFIRDLLNQNIDININEVDNNNQNALHIAVSNARETIVSLLIIYGVDINTRERSLGMTPLHLAVKGQHLSIARILLENGARLNIANKQNATVLHSAVEDENEDMIRLLLDYGANIDAKKFGKTPLHYAVEHGRINMVQLLLAMGSNINDLSLDGQTALHMAIEMKNCEMVKLLLENNAKTELLKFGKYPLYLAIRVESLDIARILLDSTKENEHREKSISDAMHLAFLKESKDLVRLFLDYNLSINLKLVKKSPLHFAAELGWEDVTRELIEKGFEVNSLGPDRLSALIVAVKNHRLNIVKVLVENGGDVNVQLERSGQTALHFAVESGDMPMVHYLLEKGAEPNVASNLSVTPLHQALDARNLEMVKLLMDHRADSNASKCGKNSLQIAVENGWIEMVKRMLDNGADPDSINENGKSVLIMAIKKHNIEMVKLLIHAGANVNLIERSSELSPLHYVLQSCFDEAATLLMDRGANLDYKTSSGLTALHLALERQDQAMVLQLLQRGADVKIKARSMPPLHVAVNRLWYDVAEILLARGASVNARTVYNATPLYFAVQKCDTRMAALLIKHGGDVNHKWAGQSLLQFASGTKCPAMVELLLNRGAKIDHLNRFCGECINALYTALKNGDDVTACLLIQRNARLQNSRRHKLGRSPLHMAAEYGCTNAAILLLNKGIPVDVLDALMMTPLHLAAKSNHLDIVDLLLSRGAKVNACSNSDLYTSLHFAIYNDNVELTQKLLKAGALMHIPRRNQQQRNSLDVAISQGRSRRLIEVLLAHDMLEEKTPVNRREIFIRLIRLSSWPLLTQLLIRHLAKFDHEIQRQYFANIGTDQTVAEYYYRCVEEIASMKGHVVYNGRTLYYFFIERGFSRERCMRNQGLLNALVSCDFKANYPIYERMLSDHLADAMMSKRIYTDVQNNLNVIFLTHLPVLVVNHILNFMTKDEIVEIHQKIPPDEESNEKMDES